MVVGGVGDGDGGGFGRVALVGMKVEGTFMTPSLHPWTGCSSVGHSHMRRTHSLI